MDFSIQGRNRQGQGFDSCPCPSKHILNRNDKSEHITNLDNVVRIIIVWSEWGDSNSRHLAPKASALPTALHPVMKFFQMWSNMWSTPFFDQLPARGKVLLGLLPQGFPGFPRTEARTQASRSQSKRATNCATPGYEIVLSVVLHVVLVVF